MTTEEIEAFVAICEAKSISKAAEQLFISQPSLSTKLKTLEQETGCTLLVRGKGQRELSLTEAGRRFYDLALQYRSIIRQMREVGTQASPEKLRVSSLNSVGTYLMAPVYERFMQQNRDTILEVQDLPTLPVCASLERRETDLAFAFSPERPRVVLSSPAFSEPMVLVCAGDAAEPRCVSIQELDPRREIYTGWFKSYIQWHEAVFGKNSVPQVRVEIMSQLLYFVRRGGWSIVPASVGRGLAEDGDVVCHCLDMEVPRRVTCCLYTADSIRRPASARFLACLRSVLTELREHGGCIELYEEFFRQFAGM